MKDDIKVGLKTLVALPIGFASYLIYVHALSLLDGMLSVLFAGAFLLVAISILYWFIINFSVFVKSMFAKNNSTEDKTH